METNHDFRSAFDHSYQDDRFLRTSSDADSARIGERNAYERSAYERSAHENIAYEGSAYEQDQAVSPQAQNTLNKYGGNRGVITTRPSRDSIVRSYSEQAAARARNARMVSQKTYHDYQINSSREKARQARREEIRSQNAAYAASSDDSFSTHRSSDFQDASIGNSCRNTDVPRTTQRYHVGRVARPLTSEESRIATRRSMETYNRERASRDVLSQNRISRTPNREVIDARGSVDSRAFNEFDELVGYSIDDRDRPEPFVDSTSSKSRWRSHAGQGFDGTRDRSNAPIGPTSRNSGVSLSNLSNTISGKNSYGSAKTGIDGLPPFVKIAVPVIVILIIILIIVVFV